MYRITETTVDHLLELMQILHTKASGSVYWPLVKSDPLVRDLQLALAALDSEVRRNRESAYRE